MISEISLLKFKKFKQTTIQLTPFSILMGENSSGKTSVIQAINLALNIFSRYGLVHDQNGKIKVRSRGVGFSELPGLTIADFRELYFAKISRGSNSKQIGDGTIGTTIALKDDLSNIYKLQISSLFGGFNVKCISNPEDLPNHPVLHKKTPLFISGFVGLNATEERSFPLAIQERLLSGQASAIIRNLILDTKIKTPANFEKLKLRLKKDFNFSLEDVEFEESRDLYVQAKYAESHEKSKVTFDFNASGSGFMQVLQILTPIYRYCPDESNIVLLDEPDAHLHPNLQASLAKALREIQKELNVQILISTHSTTIIRLAEPSEVIPISATAAINKPLASSEDVENEISTKIDTYSLGKTVLSGKLLFLEDSKTEILEAFDSVEGTMIFSGARTIPVLKGRGKDDKIPFNIQEVIQKFTGNEVEIHFLRDGDSLTKEWREKLLEYSDKKNVKMHLLERHEIENYILDSEFIFKILDKKYPEQTTISKEDLRLKIKEFIINTITLNKYQFDVNLEDSVYKTANLIGNTEYRNFNLSKSEAVKIRSQYESIDDEQELKKYGMGKETLSQLLDYLSKIGLNLSKKEIISSIDFVPDEIKNFLNSFKSKEKIELPDDLPELNNESDEEELEEENVMIQAVIPFDLKEDERK
jgi:AAA15 family ATPase/GTPase